jgi:hypothetical protein
LQLPFFSRNPAVPGNDTVKDGIPGAERSKLALPATVRRFRTGIGPLSFLISYPYALL